jgi:ATP-dependent helicase HrpB
LPELGAALARHPAAILAAPPGSGKTTRVALAMLGQSWLRGQSILLLEPRRLAARAAARYMAASLDEPIGATVGYRVRLDHQVSPRTRIEVLTEGMLTRRLQQDPELLGVGLVIFDEFHERSLQADLGLALCLDIQQGLREDLRLLLMSATLALAPLQRLLENAPLIRADGISYPVQTFYDGGGDQSAVAATVRGVQQALREGEGDVLAFLPGVSEIRRAEALLAQRLAGSGVMLCPLFGDLDAAAQDRAIRPVPGTRRVVLASAIAETSLTIDGIGSVVDSGWRRAPRFHPNSGLTRLETLRVSRAAAAQRRGRAGRLGPGRCYRMWPEGLTLDAHSDAEILQADLAPLLLELALWGNNDIAALRWLDAPPSAAVTQALRLLRELRALDEKGRISALGRRMAGLPLHPRLAQMLLGAADAGAAALGADIAALLSERDILRPADGLGRSCDVEARLSALQAWREKRSHAGLDATAARRVNQVARQLLSLLGVSGQAPHAALGGGVGALLALAYPDRVARRRPASQQRYLLANGRGARLPDEDALGGSEYLAIASLDAGQREGKVFLAARLEEGEIEHLFAASITTAEAVVWDAGRQAVEACRERRLGALLLHKQALPNPAAERLLGALLDGIAQLGIACLSWDEKARAVQARLLCLRQWDQAGGWPDVSDASLQASLDDWLAPWLTGIGSLKQLQRLDLAAILQQRLDWPRQQALQRLAPPSLSVPSGARHRLAYHPGDSPVLAVRLQEMFGQRDTPTVCDGKVPVTLHLLSPARRPLQVTQDLASFWDRTYAEVRKEMKGRYPKHYWPEDPRQARPTCKVRPS